MKGTCLWELFKINHVHWLEYYIKQKFKLDKGEQMNLRFETWFEDKNLVK